MMDGDSSTNGVLLVPVANEETASRQLDTAIDIARDRSYHVRLLFVLDVPSQLSLADGQRYLLEDETEEMVETVVEIAEKRGVSADSRVRVARGVSNGICGAINAYDVDAVLMGWRGRPPRQNIVLGSHLDRVLRTAECDVLVERIKTARPVIDTILVPVGGGPHDAFAAETAASIARQQNADVTLLHVHQPDETGLTSTDAKALLSEMAVTFEDDRSVDRVLIEHEAVAGTITDWTSEHDLTILGVSRGGLIQRKLLGTISEAVGRHAAGSVILAKRYDPVPSRLKRLIS